MIPRVYMYTVKKDVLHFNSWFINIFKPYSAWYYMCFIVPRKTGTVRFITDLIYLN